MKNEFSKPGSFKTVEGHKFVALEPTWFSFQAGDKKDDNKHQRWEAETCCVTVICRPNFVLKGKMEWATSAEDDAFTSEEKAFKSAVTLHKLKLDRAIELVNKYGPKEKANVKGKVSK